uniref:Uncharacterized protein n=1 Tax=Steinernema glaseri TaxID=37863 RepID=A0A1I7YTM8_9BILA
MSTRRPVDDGNPTELARPGPGDMIMAWEQGVRRPKEYASSPDRRNPSSSQDAQSALVTINYPRSAMDRLERRTQRSRKHAISDLRSCSSWGLDSRAWTRSRKEEAEERRVRSVPKRCHRLGHSGLQLSGLSQQISHASPIRLGAMHTQAHNYRSYTEALITEDNERRRRYGANLPQHDLPLRRTSKADELPGQGHSLHG